MLKALILLAAAVVIHGFYFSEIASRLTQPMTGRRLFHVDTYTATQFFLEAAHQTFLFLKIYLLPAGLIWGAYRLLKTREGLPARLGLSVVGLCYLLSMSGPWLFQNLSYYLTGSADEFSYLFQSRVLQQGFAAEGEGSLDFICYVLIQAVPWMSAFPVGWSAFLALFPAAWLWLGPVLCCALALLSIHLLGREIVGEEASRWGVLMVATSPGFYWQGGTFFPHHALLAALAMGTALYLWGLRKQSPALLALSGLFLAWALSIRPVETPLYLGAVGVWGILFRHKIKIPWKCLGVVVLAGGVGSLFTGIYFQYVTGFYSFVDSEPPFHFIAGLWNTCFILVRQLEWWCPFFLILIAMRWKRGVMSPAESLMVIHGVFTYLTFATFIDNGQVEFGSRYLLAGWAMMTPSAGAELQARISELGERGQSLIVFALISFGLAPLPALYQEAARRVNWGVIELQRGYPSNSVFFIRSSASLDSSVFAVNLPGKTEPRYYLFLEPERVVAFRKTIKDRPVFVLDWNGTRNIVTPFDQIPSFEDGFSRMSAANTLARLLRERERAIETWRKIPPTDPFYGAARLNMAEEYYILKRNEEGDRELLEAQRVGVPVDRIEKIRREKRKEL